MPGAMSVVVTGMPPIDPPAQAPDRHAHKYAIAALVLILLVGGSFIIWKQLFAPASSYSRENRVNDVLRRTNPDFLSAVTYAKARDYVQARDSWEKSLAGAADSTQESLIRFNIARMDELLGN